MPVCKLYGIKRDLADAVGLACAGELLVGASNWSSKSLVEKAVDFKILSLCGPKVLCNLLFQDCLITRWTRCNLPYISTVVNPTLSRKASLRGKSSGMPVACQW